jgi:hypothetical protein
LRPHNLRTIDISPVINPLVNPGIALRIMNNDEMITRRLLEFCNQLGTTPMPGVAGRIVGNLLRFQMNAEEKHG